VADWDDFPEAGAFLAMAITAILLAASRLFMFG
jgi:hypothetical protein